MSTITRTEIEDAIHAAKAEISRGGFPEEFSDAALTWVEQLAGNMLYEAGNRNEFLEESVMKIARLYFLTGFRLGRDE